MILQTVVRDCLYLNWALPAASLPEGPEQRFRDALRDDLNAPRALAVVWEVARSDALAPAILNGTYPTAGGRRSTAGHDHIAVCAQCCLCDVWA